MYWKDEERSGQYTVSGVFFPTVASPSAPLDILFSYENYLEQNKWLLNWSTYSTSTFVVLNQGTQVDQLNNDISNFIKSKDEWVHADFSLKPYSDQGYHFVSSQDYIEIVLAVVLCIIIITCINFINLSMVKSFMKEREADFKKIFESRRQLAFQHIGELVLMTVVSLSVAVLIAWAASPILNTFMTQGVHLNLDTIFMVSALSVTVFTGFSILINEQNKFGNGNSNEKRTHESKYFFPVGKISYRY